MCYVLYTRPTIQILDQFIRKQGGVHFYGIQMVELSGIQMAQNTKLVTYILQYAPVFGHFECNSKISQVFKWLSNLMAVQIQTLFEYQSKGQPIAQSQPVEKWTACFFWISTKWRPFLQISKVGLLDFRSHSKSRPFANQLLFLNPDQSGFQIPTLQLRVW